MYKIYINYKEAVECKTLQEVQNYTSAYLRLMVIGKMEFSLIQFTTSTKMFTIRETANKELFKLYADTLQLDESLIMENGKKTYIE